MRVVSETLALFEEPDGAARCDEVRVGKAGVTHFLIRGIELADRLGHGLAVERDGEDEVECAADELAQVHGALALTS